MHARTNPWNARETIRVDTFPLVYHGSRESLLVRMPGGKTKTILQLREAGHNVVLPTQFRHESAVYHKNVRV